MFVLVANLMKKWWSPHRSLSLNMKTTAVTVTVFVGDNEQDTRHKRALCAQTTQCTMWESTTFWNEEGEQFSICFRDDISPQPCSPSKYQDGEERKRSWLSALCWDAEDKFSTPRCALSYLINFQRGDATNLTTLAIKRRRRKRMTLTKINRFYFRKTFDKAQLWFSYTI